MVGGGRQAMPVSGQTLTPLLRLSQRCAVLRRCPVTIVRKYEYFDVAPDAEHFGIVVSGKEYIDMWALDGASHIFGDAIADPVNVDERPEWDETRINSHGSTGFCQVTGSSYTVTRVPGMFSGGLKSGTIGCQFAIKRIDHGHLSQGFRHVHNRIECGHGLNCFNRVITTVQSRRLHMAMPGMFHRVVLVFHPLCCIMLGGVR